MTVHHTPGHVRLRLRLPAGRIDITTVEGEDTSVEIEPLGTGLAREMLDSVREELRSSSPDDHEVVVEVPDGPRAFLFFGNQPEFAITITAPHGAGVHASTAAAGVTGRGRFGSLDLKTASGDLVFNDVEGDVAAKTASGDVRVDSIGGKASLNSVSGEVTIGEIEGAASATLVSGDLGIHKAGDGVTARTVSGDTTLRSLARGEIRLQSVSGDMTIAVAPGTYTWMDLNSISGSATSELDVGGETVSGVAPLEIRASSVSGDIRVRRAGAEARASSPA